MLSCREVVEQADALLANDLTWRSRFALQLHILMCRHCRRFVAQYRQMVRLLPGVQDNASDAEVSTILRAVAVASKHAPHEDP